MEDYTVPEPEVFNWIPREGMETTRKPSVITVKFGDGYEQRRAGGLNADLKTFKPVFRVTDEYSRAALDSFLSRHAGIRAFCGVRQNTTGLSGLSAGSGAFRIMPCIPILTAPLKRSLTDAGYTAGNTQ